MNSNTIKITFGGSDLIFHDVGSEFLNNVQIRRHCVSVFKKVIKIIEDDSILIIKLNDFQYWHKACVWSDF